MTARPATRHFGARSPVTPAHIDDTRAHPERPSPNLRIPGGFKVGATEQDELLNILAPLREEIVEVGSGQTGTPLPSEFTPAPALSAAQHY
jgi:hypothetical protein